MFEKEKEGLIEVQNVYEIARKMEQSLVWQRKKKWKLSLN